MIEAIIHAIRERGYDARVMYQGVNICKRVEHRLFGLNWSISSLDLSARPLTFWLEEMDRQLSCMEQAIQDYMNHLDLEEES